MKSYTNKYNKNKQYKKQKRGANFIDKTFTVLADIVLKVLPASKQEKEAFSYYRDGMSAQSEGEYAEALENYYEALQLEEDPYDRSYILYNIGLIYSSNGEYIQALEYYHQALELNLNLPQALNNIAVIYHYQGVKASKKQNLEVAKGLFDKAAEYWKQAIKLAPNNYIEAQNWLKITGRLSSDNFY
jgi:tetratricopeptide (TPR) repeat protein